MVNRPAVPCIPNSGSKNDMVRALECVHNGFSQQKARKNVARKCGEHARDPASKGVLPREGMMTYTEIGPVFIDCDR